MSTRVALGALVGAALGAGVAVVMLAKPAAPACDTDALRAELVGMRAELVALRLQVSRVAQAPDPAPAPSRVTLKILSDPQGADVVDDGGRLLGRTPLVLTVPSSSTPRAFTLRRSGYSDMVVELTPDKDVEYAATLAKGAAAVRPNPYRPPMRPADDLLENPFDSARPKR